MRPSERSLRLIDATEPRDWLPGPGSVLLKHDRLNVTIHHVVWMQGEKRLYDQPLICEPIGVIGILIDRASGKIGMIQAQRPLARYEEVYAAGLPNVDPANLGRIVYEAPRGLPVTGEQQGQTINREVEEESGGLVRRKERLPLRVSLNSTYFPQTVPVWLVEVDMSRQSKHEDPMEGVVGRAQFFTLAEYVELRERNECVDPIVGDAIAYLLLTRPGLLK